MTAAAPIMPTDEEHEEFVRVQHVLSSKQTAYLVGPGGEKTAIPHALYEVLLQAVKQLARGRGVSVVPATDELTTQQAADLLNISRPSFIKLLEEGAMPFRTVGTHRRVALSDVMAHRARRTRQRKQALGELAREALSQGMYD